MEAKAVRLFHYSEEPDIAEFVPRLHVARPDEARVWAIDEAFAPLYYFGRSCPRAAFWALPTSTPEDANRFLGQTAAKIVVAIESSWLAPLQNTVLYEYEFPTKQFAPLDAPQSPAYHGVHIARETVRPLSVRPMGDLLALLAGRPDVELRVTPSLWPLYDVLLASSLHYSFVRFSFAQPRPKNTSSQKELINTL